MIVKTLMGEFLHEAENTRKLFKAITDSALSFKPSDKSWSTAEMAAHVAQIYDMLLHVLTEDKLDVAERKYDKGDISSAAAILQRFEENAARAKAALEAATDESMNAIWTFSRNGQPLIPPMPRAQVIRFLIYNHIYHHRGELIVYLRATGNRVPGLYGPSADDLAGLK